MMDALLGLLDKAIDEGANGSSHKARDQIRAYQLKYAHDYDEID